MTLENGICGIFKLFQLPLISRFVFHESTNAQNEAGFLKNVERFLIVI